jgi:hypothetical protein
MKTAGVPITHALPYSSRERSKGGERGVNTDGMDQRGEVFGNI